MKIQKEKFKKRNGYLEAGIDAVDRETASVAMEYKKKIAGKFMSITPDEIDLRVKGEDLFVSRKMDGELAVIFYEEGNIIAINTGGTVRMGLPPLDEAGSALKNAGIASAVLAAELHVDETDGRKRVFDVLSALSEKNGPLKLRLAVFDILSLDGKLYNTETYDKVMTEIHRIFHSAQTVQPVQYIAAKSKTDIKAIYNEWVTDKNAEGIVIRSEMPFIYKVKTKHTVDAAVIGYTEKSDAGLPVFDSLLMALKRDEKTFQIIGKVGVGLSDAHQELLYKRLKTLVVESDHIETNRKRVAYRMVKPEVVLELGLHDILVETPKGDIKNTLLTFENDRYTFLAVTPGVSIIFPVIERERKDKTPGLENLRFSQLSDLVYIPGLKKEIAAPTLEKSRVIFREVYTRQSKGNRMVQKFVVWKTNKESAGDRHLAYVMHYTNYSPDRKDMLKREVRISAGEDQIMEITRGFIEENIKAGWSLYHPEG